MNNRGFTLIELLATLVVISLIVLLCSKAISNTLSIGDNEAYELTKKNIIFSANTYVLECSNNIIECANEYSWNGNNTSFLLNVLLKHNYFNKDFIINPITNKDVSDCLIINVERNIYSKYIITLDDSNC